MQSSLQNNFHVAIIMDGNGRWAEEQNLPRFKGHEQGVKTIRKIMKAAPQFNIKMLTLYAFSSDNWKRPKSEVSLLMNLLRHYLTSEINFFIENKIRLVIIGRRDRLPKDIIEKMNEVETITKRGANLTLRIALDYSARHAIVEAANAIAAQNNLNEASLSKTLSGIDQTCDVDFLIRTSGEQRLSDFLLWECAYSELYFTKTYWPDFTAKDLKLAMQEFKSRKRRFGALEIETDIVLNPNPLMTKNKPINSEVTR